jgi:hypothetical protein
MRLLGPALQSHPMFRWRGKCWMTTRGRRSRGGKAGGQRAQAGARLGRRRQSPSWMTGSLLFLPLPCKKEAEVAQWKKFICSAAPPHQGSAFFDSCSNRHQEGPNLARSSFWNAPERLLKPSCFPSSHPNPTPKLKSRPPRVQRSPVQQCL